ncbi:hypothetical protein D3C86_1965780 [compost metagenome]
MRARPLPSDSVLPDTVTALALPTLAVSKAPVAPDSSSVSLPTSPVSVPPLRDAAGVLSKTLLAAVMPAMVSSLGVMLAVRPEGSSTE